MMDKVRACSPSPVDRTCDPPLLERGRFIWPAVVDGAVSITAAQLGYLLEGIDWRAPQQTWRPQAAG